MSNTARHSCAHLNVLLALNSFEDDGPGRLVLGMARHWAKTADLTVRALSVGRGGPLEDDWRALGIRAEVVNARGPWGIQKLHAWCRQLHDARGARPHLVNTHLLWPDLAMRWVMGDLGAPVLLSTSHGLHALGEKGPVAGAVYRQLESATRHEVDAWVGVSKAVARDLHRWGVPADQVHVIDNGIEPGDFPPITPEERARARAKLRVADEDFVVGAIGNLRPVKGHDVLLRGFAGLARRVGNARLVIVGEGPERARLGALAAELGIADRIAWLGHLRTGVGRVLAALDVLAHPSRAEAFGLAVAEAQCRGLAAVVTRAGGLPEVVKDNETGLVVEREKPAAVARALEQLALDADLRRRMGDAGARRIRERFDIADSAKRYVDLWRRLIERQTSSDRGL